MMYVQTCHIIKILSLERNKLKSLKVTKLKDGVVGCLGGFVNGDKDGTVVLWLVGR